MVIDEAELKPIKGNQLYEGATFYIKHGDGDFERAVVERDWQRSRGHLWNYRQWITKLSSEGKLYFNRERPGHDFTGMPWNKNNPNTSSN